MTAELATIQDLSVDDENLNAGTPRADSVIEQSLQRLGAGRSIVVDKNGKTIAGNHVLQKAQELGFEVELVHTNGSRLVVVVRDDLDLETDAKARELSIADNRASELGLSWRMQKLEEMRMRYAGLKTDYLFTSGELRKAAERIGDELQARTAKTHECPNCGHKFQE